MKLEMIKNPDFKWYKPKTWAKVPKLTLDKCFIYVQDNIDVKDVRVLNLRSGTYIGSGVSYYQRKRALRNFEKYLFPKRKNKKWKK